MLHTGRIVIVRDRKANSLDFADNMVILTENEIPVNKLFKNIARNCEKHGIRLNVKKTREIVARTSKMKVNIKTTKQKIK